MSANIVLKVSPEALLTASSELEAKIGEIEKQFSEIESEVTRSRSYWEGEASSRHVKKYDDVKADLQSAVAILRQQKDKLLQLHGLYTETESIQTEQTALLSEDVIV